MVQNDIFNVLHWQVGEVADAFLAATAEEVEIVDTMSVGRLRDDEATVLPALVAPVAPQSALEVVVMGPSALAAHTAGIEDGLDSVKQFLTDKRLVTPGILSSLVGDDAQVVAVSQHHPELRVRYRPCRIPTCPSL